MIPIKNSSGKQVGEVEKTSTQIIINTWNKPQVIIKDKDLLQSIANKDNSAIIILYDNYTCTIGEIAAVFETCYSAMWKKLKRLEVKTAQKAGRRNSSYGQQFSEERKRKIGEKSRGRIIKPYERTPEIRAKISASLKEYFASHPVSEETRQKLSDAWKRGCYDNAKMGRGIQGYFHSYKMDKDYYFRSLLELKFLVYIEENNKVQEYIMEPFLIPMNDNHHYMPDLLINNNIVVELKPRAHLSYEDKDRWENELYYANEFCKRNNYQFKVIYDDEIGFESKKYRQYLIDNPELIEQYQIRFKKEL